MQVFISHASSDEALAREISAALREAGLEVWDGTEILPGENWAAKVAQALQDSHAMVVLLTPDALRSNHVKHEISYALGNQHYEGRLIPVFVTPSHQLSSADAELPWILKSFQGVSLLPEEQNKAGFQKVANAVQAANLAAL